MQTETRYGREEHDVVAWRRRQLLDSGFSLPLASAVARDHRFDLHQVIELAERGCAPELAVRILRPLDGDPA
jgi:hypothetical protein